MGDHLVVVVMAGGTRELSGLIHEHRFPGIVGCNGNIFLFLHYRGIFIFLRNLGIAIAGLS